MAMLILPQYWLDGCTFLHSSAPSSISKSQLLPAPLCSPGLK